MKLYVGNLSYETTEGDLRNAFEGYGKVNSVNIITDKYTGKSRGFGFVEMDNGDEANEAMSNLNETELHGRNLNINEARDRNDKRGGGGFQKKRRDGYRENW
jgi:RNA recognition motif-containing protein